MELLVSNNKTQQKQNNKTTQKQNIFVSVCMTITKRQQLFDYRKHYKKKHV